jgi:hypothetical protein
MPAIKRVLEKKGVNLEKSVNEAFKDPKHGLSVLRSWAFLFLLAFFICIALGNLYFVLTHGHPDMENYRFVIIFYAIISTVFNQLLVFKQKEYLLYFKKFDKMSIDEKKKWAWISFATITGIIFFMIGSFYLLVQQKR